MPDSRYPGFADETVIPLVEEQLSIDKREVETGRVRVHVRNETRDVRVSEALVRGDVDVERIRIDRRIESVPEVREVGGTIIVPIVEEVIVVEKRLMLREEVHIRRRSRVDTHEESVSLIRQRADVERVDVGSGDASPSSVTTTPAKDL